MIMNKKQKKILFRVIISMAIIAVYLFGGKQLLKSDPKGLNFFFLIFAGSLFSLVMGIISLVVVAFKKKHWVKSLLFILTAISNTLMIIICITMNNDNILLHLLCYSGVVIGITQLYLLTAYYLRKDKEVQKIK